MKIGVDGRFIRREQTGNGVFTQLFLEGLARLDSQNDYTVYLLEDIPFIDQDNFLLKQMPAPHANPYLRFIATFPLELFRHPVDIFHAIYTVPLLPGKRSVRTVLSLVEFAWFTNPEEFPASSLFLRQIRIMTRQSIRRADRIITPTQLGRNQLLDYFDLPRERVEVVPFGVNEKFIEPCDPEQVDRVRKKYAIARDYILTVSDLHPRKNLARLIDAFTWLKETRRIPHQLVIVGKARWQAQTIYGRASASSARDSIIFTGYAPFEDLRPLYRGASVFAFPSLDEGFGLPVHEAMASQVPVVTSDRGALPEVAGDAAVVVDPLSIEAIGTAIAQVLESPDFSEVLAKKGLEQIRGFSWKSSCGKLMSVYQDLDP
jgi:glycosyltransferase involved in cell wall biosynthesis